MTPHPHNLMTRVLLLSGFLISLPVYFLILYFLGDPFLDHTSDPGDNKKTNIKTLAIVSLGGIEFEPIALEQITSTKKLLESMLMTVEIKSGQSKQNMYLRTGSYETFSRSAMESPGNLTSDSSWPNFALNSSPKNSSSSLQTAYLHFFCNFEARLPHPPTLRNLAGPLNFCAMHDGSIMFDNTIAVGDEFEVEFAASPRLVHTDKIAMVATNSEYLTLGPLECTELYDLAENITSGIISSAAIALQLAEYLEKKGIYIPDTQPATDLHPVKQFLLYDMQGHCQHFAAGLTALCRLQGIPARVATGFCSNVIKDGKFLVVKGMGHAWTEILTDEGWKIVDVSPSAFEQFAPVDPHITLPSLEQLASLIKSSDDSPSRLKNQQTKGEIFTPAKNPGTVVKNNSREEKFRMEGQAAKEKATQIARKKRINRVKRQSIPFLVLTALSWLIWKKHEKLLLWATKLLNGSSQTSPVTQSLSVEQTRELLASISEPCATELAGVSLAELFQSFTALMAEKGKLPRIEHETPGEYFERLCITLIIKPADGRQAACFLEAEIYGQHQLSMKDYQLFLQLLRQMIAKVT